MPLAATHQSIPLPNSPEAASSGAPPPALPGAHFAAALTFLMLGGLGLVAVAPKLAQGAFSEPRVIAVVHLFTLGFIALSIFGALCQFLPVAIGRGFSVLWLPRLCLGLVAGGVLVFVAGLCHGQRALTLTGAGALVSGFLLFATQLAATLVKAKQRPLSWWALFGAAIFLGLTPVYGGLLALNLYDGSLGADRYQVLAVHAHVAIAGFVLLVMLGVAHRLLPMFLLSHGASERAAWVSLCLLVGGSSVLTLPLGSAGFAIAGALISGGVVAFLAQALAFFRHRKRRAIDPGMRLAAAGLFGLSLAVLIAPFALLRGLTDVSLLSTYFVVLLGAITLFVAGHYYKIVPFLVWYHRFGPLVGTRKVPRVSELYSEKVALINGALLVCGWLGLAVAVYAGFAWLARISAVVLSAGTLLEAVVMLRISRRRPA